MTKTKMKTKTKATIRDRKITIKEAIIVEGRDDTAAIRRAVDAMTIETHGFGMPDSIWPQIDKAYEDQGIIVFTDPDYAGEKIRRSDRGKISRLPPAFFPKGSPEKRQRRRGNARPRGYHRSAGKAHCTSGSRDGRFTEEDLFQWELAGGPRAKARREQLGNLLSIGYGNSKSFLRKLNQFQISGKNFWKRLRN